MKTTLGVVILSLGLLGFSAYTATAATSAKLPSYFHWGSTSDHHKKHPCLVAWGGKGSQRAEICSDGFAVVVKHK